MYPVQQPSALCKCSFLWKIHFPSHLMTVCTDRSSYRNKGKEVRDLCVAYPTSAKTMTDRLNVAIKCRWHHSDISSNEWKVHKWLQKDQREQNNHKLDQKHFKREGAEEILKNRARTVEAVSCGYKHPLVWTQQHSVSTTFSLTGWLLYFYLGYTCKTSGVCQSWIKCIS